MLEEPEHLNWFHPASDNFWRSGPRWAPAPPPPRAGGRYSRKAVFGPSREGCQGLPGHGSFRGQFGPGPRPLGGNTLVNSTARRTPPLVGGGLMRVRPPGPPPPPPERARWGPQVPARGWHHPHQLPRLQPEGACRHPEDPRWGSRARCTPGSRCNVLCAVLQSAKCCRGTAGERIAGKKQQQDGSSFFRFPSPKKTK